MRLPAASSRTSHPTRRRTSAPRARGARGVEAADLAQRSGAEADVGAPYVLARRRRELDQAGPASRRENDSQIRSLTQSAVAPASAGRSPRRCRRRRNRPRPSARRAARASPDPGSRRRRGRRGRPPHPPRPTPDCGHGQAGTGVGDGRPELGREPLVRFARLPPRGAGDQQRRSILGCLRLGRDRGERRSHLLGVADGADGRHEARGLIAGEVKLQP